MDLYRILNIPKEASHNEIKSAYRNLAKQYHPDLNDGQISDKWTEIRQAYELLIDPEKRQMYDESGYIPDNDENIYRSILSFLRSFFDNVYNTQDNIIDSINILSNILNVCDQNIKQSQNEINMLKYKKRKVQKIFKKFKRKTELKQDLLFIIHTEEIQKIKNDITMNYHNINMFKTLKNIMNCYDFDITKYLEGNSI